MIWFDSIQDISKLIKYNIHKRPRDFIFFLWFFLFFIFLGFVFLHLRVRATYVLRETLCFSSLSLITFDWSRLNLAVLTWLVRFKCLNHRQYIWNMLMLGYINLQINVLGKVVFGHFACWWLELDELFVIDLYYTPDNINFFETRLQIYNNFFQ